MKTELIDITKLTLDPSNVRTHDERNLDAIKGSLQKFGQQKPIVVGKDGVVVAGNGTLVAAQSLGWKKIAIVRTPLEGADRTAYAIADNRTAELAEWDNEALAETLKGLDEELQAAAGFDDLDELLGDDKTELKPIETKVPPKMAWVLIGIPVVRFDEIAEVVEELGQTDGIVMETVVADR